jgi:hypothetical protein
MVPPSIDVDGGMVRFAQAQGASLRAPFVGADATARGSHATPSNVRSTEERQHASRSTGVHTCARRA